jgi:protein FRG1
MFIVCGDTFSLLKVNEEGGNLSLEECEEEGLPEEPRSTSNVLIGQNLIPHVFSFKSPFGKYLTTDSLGQVNCNKDAVNPLAEWTLIIKPEGVSLQSVNQKFLSFDPKTGRLRCDSENIGFNERFIIKCQADRKKKRLLEKFQEERRSNLKNGTSQKELETLEEIEVKRMQSRGKLKASSSNDLKRAAEEGNLREILLERRIKSKHDPFC